MCCVERLEQRLAKPASQDRPVILAALIADHP
jgi:hypothetical protein